MKARRVLLIELLEHNKETYKRLCDVLKENNKCALVQATGTGKSYIAGKYIEEHTNTALILVPTNAIADAWSDLLSGNEQEVDIITYQAFAKEPNNYLEYDLVIADEMHHLGSEVWGKKFVETYLQSENHKIIGLTATEIRYLDNSRDMAEEIFENIRVDGCDLPTAINTGVLPTFKYVSALYCDESDFDEWKEKVGKIKDIKTQTELKGRLDVCIKNMVSVKQAVNENLTDDYKKIIVFLNNVESKETALEMFKDVFPTANFYDVDYGKSRAENNSQIEKFKSDSDRAVLFAVDMLNEGIHVKGTDCIIMFRKTVSPQIYLQQLGRALSSETNITPIIFDFVSNIGNIEAKLNERENKTIIERFNEKIDKGKNIIMKSYTKDMEEILEEISSLSQNYWTKEEDDYIKENYGKILVSEISKNIKRTEQAIITRAHFLGVSQKLNFWSEEDKNFLINNYGKMTNEEIAEVLGKTKSSVQGKITVYGLANSKKWGKEDIDFLKQNYKTMTSKEIAFNIGKTESSINAAKIRFGLSKSNLWKKQEDDFLMENYGRMSIEEISKILNRAEPSVRGRVSRLRIKSPIYWTKDEENYLMENYHKIDINEISKKLNRSTNSIKSKALILGITRKYKNKSEVV